MPERLQLKEQRAQSWHWIGVISCLSTGACSIRLGVVTLGLASSHREIAAPWKLISKNGSAREGP